MRAWKQGQFGVRGNSASAGTIRQGQFGVTGQFGVSSSLLLLLHQFGGTIRCQFVIIASLAGDNSGRVDLGGRPPRPPTDPGLHITRTRFLIS